jgi:hypothetical protein
MGWAEDRIQEYQHGKPATWLERRMLEHANPVNFSMSLAATAGFVYGLWMHDWFWIIGSSVAALFGHVYCWTRKNGKVHHDTGLAQSGASVSKAG